MQAPINKSKKQKTLIDIQTINLAKAIIPSITIQQRKQIFKYIYQLKIKQHIELRQLLDVTLQSKQLEQLIQQFNSLMGFFKEYQAVTPIVDLFYGGYKKAILQKNYNIQIIWNNWKHVPISNLQDYIQSFKLQELIDKIDKNQFYEIIRELLLKSKNKQAALYCTLFKIGDKNFLIDEVMPRLLQGQDIYTNYVTNLFKNYPILLDAIVEQLDPVAAIRIVQTAGGNVIKYPTLIKHLQRAAFNHNSHQFKQWFKCQQIMAFCPTFLEWYANQHLQQPMRMSLLVRHNLKEGEQIVQNPLFSNDNFTYTQQIIGKQKDKKFWKLDLFDIKQTDVVFVDNDSSDSFNLMQQVLFSSNIVGFDSEFRATSHKYESDGVSIIQLSSSKKVFIIDFITLDSSQKTINLLRKLFNSKEILKVGHSLKCDFLYLNKTFDLQSSSLNSFIDIMDLFKIKYPNQIQSSLSHIVLALTGIQLSKYEQRSNWNRRPLRRAQLHYAAIDAYICEIVYEKLNENIELNSLQVQKSQKTQGLLLITQGWLSYGPQFKYFLKKPKFIVDNMLKKLSTYLRNLGLDAQYLSVRDFEVAISIASIQQRIVLTKDKHLKFKKNMRVPCYLIQSQQSQTMTKQVVAAFKIKLQQYTLLSRCVKCNNSDLILVDTATALAKLNFKHPDSAIKQFWCCTKCQQFYWQGHSYNNSRKRFSTFI